MNHNLGSGGAEKLIYDMALELQKMGKNFSIILLTSVNCMYGKRLLEKGIDVIYLSDKWDIYSPKNIYRLIKVLKNYDVIHTHIYSAQLWTAFSSYFLKNKRYITTEHNTNNNRRGKDIFRVLDRWMYSRYNTVVSITTETEAALKEWIGLVKDYRVVENGIDINRHLDAKPLKRNEFGFTQSDILICQIGRLNDVKNQEVSISTLKKLPNQYKLLLLGEGDRKKFLEYLALELGVEDRVYFLGYRDDIPNLLKMVDLSILTSHYEGLPISAIESMLLTPFIGSNVPGIKELVADAGISFELDNKIELRDKILDLMNNKTLYQKIKKSCYEKAKAFSIENTLKKYLKIYEERI